MGEEDERPGETSTGGYMTETSRDDFEEILASNPLFNTFDMIDEAIRKMQADFKALVIDAVRAFPDPPGGTHLFSGEGEPGVYTVVPASEIQKYECMDPFFFDFELQRNFLADLIFRSPFSKIRAILLEICTPKGSMGLVARRHPAQQHYWWRTSKPHRRFHPEFIYQVKTILLLTEKGTIKNDDTRPDDT